MTDTRYRSNVALDDIEPSPTNPRKTFDEAALQELAENIKTHGVITPILLRTSPPLRPKTYELIFGERRWRAARLAGIASVPAVIRDDLSDAEILEMQMIENLQRQDLHPIEEAEGYGLMMRDHGYTADTLAEKIGKSRSYIFGRMKLLDLNEEGRRLFRGGLLNPSTALLVARIPTQALQMKAIEDITRRDFRNDVMSVRQAQKHIQDRYMLRLDSAPFPIDAPDLIATAGCCTSCPKRTGNRPELFDDVDSENVCTDPDCFAAKRLAQAERRLQAAGPDVKIISGEEADKVMPSYAVESRTHVKLDSVCYDDPERRTYRQIMADDQKGIALVEQRDKTDLVEVVEKKVIAEKLRNAGIVTGKEKEKADQKKLQAKVNLANGWRDRLLRAVREKASNTMLMDLMAAAMAVIAHRFIVELGADRGGKVAGLWGAIGSDNYTRWEAIKLALPSMSVGDLLRFCLDCALIAEHKTDQYGYERDPACMITVAEKLGLDAEALFQAEKDAQKAAEQAKKAPKKPKKSKPDDSGEAPYPLTAAQAQDSTGDKNHVDATEAAQAGDGTTQGELELSPATAGEGNKEPSWAQPKFAEGDRVRVTGEYLDYIGKTGVVFLAESNPLNGIWSYQIRLDDGAELESCDDEIERYEEPNGDQPGILPGYVVRVKDDACSEAGYPLSARGKVGKVVSADDDEDWFIVEFIDGGGEVFHRNSLTYIGGGEFETNETPAAAEPAFFRPEDRVRVKNDAKGPGGHLRKCCGKEGQIEFLVAASAIPGHEMYVVNIDGASETINLRGDELLLILRAAAAPKKQRPTVPYQHPEDNDLTWSGRGRKPKWVQDWIANGGTLEDLKTTGATA